MTPDQPDQGTAAANRAELESVLLAGGAMTLDRGAYALDRAGIIDRRGSGLSLAGRGVARTSLKNAFTQSPYPDDATLVLADWSANGYADSFQYNPATPSTITVADATNFAPGRVVFLWKWKGSGDPPGPTGCVRRRVLAAGGNAVTLDGPVPPGVNVAKWVAGYYVPDAKPGDVSITLDPSTPLPTAGQLVLITSGPTTANELPGEVRTVAGNAGSTTITLDRPLLRPHAQAVLVPWPAVRDAEVSDLTVEQPVNMASGTTALVVRAGYRLTMNRVAATGLANLTACAKVATGGCEFRAGLQVNSSHDCRLDGGSAALVYYEEQCLDHDLVGVSVGPSAAGGVICSGDCDRVRVRGCYLQGVQQVPVSLSGRGHEVTDCTVLNCGGAVYLAGSNLRVNGLRSNVPVYVKGGFNNVVTNVFAPAIYLGVDGVPSGGTYSHLHTPNLVIDPAGDWKPG
jgi:hypothetical protein